MQADLEEYLAFSQSVLKKEPYYTILYHIIQMCVCVCVYTLYYKAQPSAGVTGVALPRDN